MAKTPFNQKKYLAQLVKSSGYVLLDILLVLFLLQCVFYFAWPNFKMILLQQHCRRFVFELESILEWTSVQASLQSKSLSIVLDKQLQVQLSKSLVLRVLPIQPFQLEWNSRHALMFHFNPLHNHLNGYFSLNCGSGIRYNLWLNRMGHTRIESL
jgi:hypothetical protein